MLREDKNCYLCPLPAKGAGIFRQRMGWADMGIGSFGLSPGFSGRFSLAGLALVLALSIPLSARADLESGRDMSDMCFGTGKFAGELKEVAEGVCWGFITGIGNVMVSGHEVARQQACAPETGPGSASRGEMIEIVKSYLQANENKLSVPAFVLVAEALAEAFPCPPS